MFTKKYSIITITIISVSCVFAGILIASNFNFIPTSWSYKDAKKEIKNLQTEAQKGYVSKGYISNGGYSNNFVELVKHEKPAVVNISTTQII
ncbi:MAG: hypothetical protein V1872_03020, partial [bacterium]